MSIRAPNTHFVSSRPAYRDRFVRSPGKDGKVRRNPLLSLGSDVSLLRSLCPRVTRLTGDAFSGQAPLLAAAPEILTPG